MANKRVCLMMMTMTSMFVTCEATAFLGATPTHVVTSVSAEDVQTSLLAEIEGSLGTGIASKRVTEMKAILSPMFISLPKNEHGNLGHVTVRYVMHRVFVQRHGWFIEGLDTSVAAWNASSPSGILKNQVPAYIESMFEKRLGGRGLGLEEVAVFAATIEHLVHNEGMGRLGSALNVHEMLPTDSMTTAQADEVLDTYMMAYLLSWDLTKMTLKSDTRRKAKMPEIYPGWANTQAFVRQIREEVTTSMSVGSTSQDDKTLSFAMLAKVAEVIGERFGTFQNTECKGVKAALMKMQEGQTGRVRLSSFYKDALDGKDGAWQFQESISYLRTLGALDESNSDEPRVMIPNYLISKTNCLASSDYYSVCCHNECEDLMVHLEHDIAAPEATSSRIAAVISTLPSSTVPAPRELSATLRARLEQIGVDHGGSVQLHSRLFAQWMHHAFPRECPYPHMSGTTSQDKPTVANSVASDEELEQFGNTANIKFSEAPEDMHDLMMWSHEEELLVSRPAVVPVSSTGFAATARSVVGVAAVVSAAVALVRTASPSMSGNEKEMQQKFMV